MLSHVFLMALKVMDVVLKKAVQRQILIQMRKDMTKLVIFKKDKIEIYVERTLKEGWTIWGEDDIKEALKIAKEFGCKIDKE